MSDLELMRERLLEATLARPEADESLIRRILASAHDRAAPLAPLLPAPRTWPRWRLWLDAACMLAVVSLMAWAFLRTGPTPPANTPACTPTKSAPANIEPLPGADFENSDPPRLHAGLFWLTTGAPMVRVGRARLEMLGGRAMLKVGTPSADDASILNPWLDGHPQAANLEERKMLLDTSKWLIRGALALCLVAGAIEIDGEIIRAESENDPDAAEIDDYFLPTDTDKNASVSWEECLGRDRTARKNQPGAGDEAAQKKWLERYQWRIDREEYLFADTNDDYKLTREEWRKYLDSRAEPGKEDPNKPEEKLSDKDLAALCTANTADQWPSLLRDADANGDAMLTTGEIGKHFLFLFDEGEEAEKEQQAFNLSFTKADTNRDGRLNQDEYAVFSAAEHRRGQCYYAEFLIYHGGEDSVKTQVAPPQAAKPNKVKIGTVWYVRTAERRKVEAKRGAEDGTMATKWRYTKFTITEMSKLGFKARGYATDEELKAIDKKDECTRAHTWDKGAEPASPKIEFIEVGGVKLECYVYDEEYEPTVNGEKQSKVHEQSWVLTTCPMIIVKHVINGRIIEETLKFEE